MRAFAKPIRPMMRLAPVLAGEPLSLDEAEMRPALARFVAARLGSSADREDIVQEVYVRLYDYRRTRTIGDVGAFCFAVARNLVRDQLRFRQRWDGTAEVPEDIPCLAPRADEVLDYRQRVEVLIRALRAMPPLRREVFTRRRLDGTAVATIALDLDMSHAAVEKHCGRAMADLRHALERRGLGLGAGA